MYASEAKKSEFLVHLDRFSKYLKYLRKSEKRSKLTKNSDFFSSKAYATLSHHFELNYSQIKIDLLSLHVLYSLHFKIGAHLLKVELT